MSTIRCIYTEEPRFPATDQHPDAVRFKVGTVWVDAIGGLPTQGEIDAVLAPPGEDKLTIEDLATALLGKGLLTNEELDAAQGVAERAK